MAQPSYSCPRCSGPLSWTPQYAKWYCYRCSAYPFDAPAAAAPPEPATDPNAPKCPTCSSQLSYVSEYKAWYCYSCRKYAAVADAQHSMARCPTCSSQLTFSAEHQKWYCYSCKKYVGGEETVKPPRQEAAAEVVPPPPAGSAVPAGQKPAEEAAATADGDAAAGPAATPEPEGDATPAPAVAPGAASAAASAPSAPATSATPEQLMLTELKRSRIPRKEERKPEVRKETIIEDVFLLYNDGRLIRHYTRRLKPTVDSEILSSMLMAVSAFVKDSRITEDETEGAGLDEIKYGALRIHLARGRFVTVAMLIQGDDAEGVVGRARRQIQVIETENESIVKEWDGKMSAMQPVHKHIESLFG